MSHHSCARRGGRRICGRIRSDRREAPAKTSRRGEQAMSTPARPPVVSKEEWIAARRSLLELEKVATRLTDAINAARRRLPMVRVDSSYVFEGPDGKLTLTDLFEGRSLLYVHHFMWIDSRDTGCPRCTEAADIGFTPATLAHLHMRDVTFAAIARAPWPKLAAYKSARGWTFPFYSSYGTTFNYDFRVTLDEAHAPIEYNFRDKPELVKRGIPEAALNGDFPGNSVFLRDGNDVFHTYSAYARGLDRLFMPYNFLDLTVYGRQEAWEDSPEGWPRLPMGRH
jgi:predicted dithiol-disulfide oxidoreductase (DUF899 family)